MANGIESRYTGIPIVPEVIEEKTRPWDAIESLYGMVKQEEARTDKKKLDWAELNAKIESSQDLKDFRSDSIDVQNREADNLRAHRKTQSRIQQQNAATAAAKQKSDAEYQEMTAFTNRIALLPIDDRHKEILLNPDYMKYAGTNRSEVIDKMNSRADYKQDQMKASGFIKSNNPLKIQYHMQKLQDGELDSSTTAREIYAKLQSQLPEAQKFQKELYEVTPKEIAEMYPEYANNLKTIAQEFMPSVDWEELSEGGGDMLTLMTQQAKQQAVPREKMSQYNAVVRKVTDSYANKYRMKKGIGTYDASAPFATLQEEADLKIAPDDYTLSDERYELIEKAQEENNPLWEKWLNEEDYTFEDLKTDYEAGLKADDSKVKEGDATAPGTEGEMTEEQQKAIYAQGLKDNPFLATEQTLEEFLPKEEVKQAEVFYDKDFGNWFKLKDGKMIVANTGEIAAARAQGIGPKKTEIKISAKKGNLEKNKKSLVNAQKNLEGVKRAGKKKQITYWQGQVDKYKKKISDIEAM